MNKTTAQKLSDQDIIGIVSIDAHELICIGPNCTFTEEIKISLIDLKLAFFLRVLFMGSAPSSFLKNNTNFKHPPS